MCFLLKRNPDETRGVRKQTLILESSCDVCWAAAAPEFFFQISFKFNNLFAKIRYNFYFNNRVVTHNWMNFQKRYPGTSQVIDRKDAFKLWQKNLLMPCQAIKRFPAQLKTACTRSARIRSYYRNCTSNYIVLARQGAGYVAGKEHSQILC